MGEVREYNFLVETFQTEKRIMQFCCYLKSKNPQWYNYAFGFFLYSSAFLELNAMIIGVSMETEFTKMSETLLYCTTCFTFLFKLTHFIHQNPQMTKIEQILTEPILGDLSMDEKDIVKKYLISVGYLALIFRILCFGVVVLYCMFPFVDEDPDHMLPLPIWVPFDVKKYKYYLNIYETVGIATGASINSTIDILATILMTLAAAHFEILKKRLKEVGNDKRVLQKKLDNCVKYHNAILNFVQEVENMFTIGLMVQFICSVIVICLTGFQMLVIPYKSMQFVLLMIYFSTMFCQIVLYCWYGNEMMFASDGIPEACYMTEWNEFPVKARKNLFLIMEKGKSPVTMTAGKLFTLTLTTLMGIMKSSYSYFAVLRTMYSKKNH